jgi:hypothetical protein
MRCLRASVAALCLFAPANLRAQEWNDARVTELVARATERRARQLADTGLTDYTATALGSLTFLAQVGEGFPDPPKVVKADQIALEVYWRAPNQSKQLILGRRDTLLLPTDIQYHRDHLGIVQNNFPQIIRLGDGDEVRDVPHPLSAAGLAAYDFAISDSMRIEIPGQVIEVYEVRIRPKNDRVPAAVGAVYVSRADVQVVRMAFSFTRAALIDPQLDDVSIVLDNALIEERFWLPRRQEIEIRRSGTWLDFPARGIIRGGFEVCCYKINNGVPASRFAGPEIDLAPPNVRANFQFEQPLRDVVPTDLATVSSEEVARVQARALEMVRQSALERTRSGALLAGSISELARFNRVEGTSLGLGVRRRLASGLELGVTGRYGLADDRAKAAARLTWRWSPYGSLRVGVFDEVRDASDVMEVSGLRNSLAAQEWGIDYTEPYRVRGADLRFELRRRSFLSNVTLARERTDSLTVEASPTMGTFRPAPGVLSQSGWRAEQTIVFSPQSWLGGTRILRVAGQLRKLDNDPGLHPRFHLAMDYERSMGNWTLLSSTFLGLASTGLTQDLFRAGGPVSAPGYRAHEFASTSLLSERIEAQVPIPFVTFPIGRWGRSPGRATLAPYASWLVFEAADAVGSVTHRLQTYPSVGAGLLVFFDLVRFDVARGIRNGRWSFGVDISRDLWRIL